MDVPKVVGATLSEGFLVLRRPKIQHRNLFMNSLKRFAS